MPFAPIEARHAKSLNTLKKNIQNPFVEISRSWRVLLVVYVVVYNILTPGLREILANSAAPLSGARLLVEIIRQVLLFAPIFFYRAQFGWLHPLIFSTVFSLAKNLIKKPGHLLAPLTLGKAPVEALVNPRLPGFTERQMAWATLEHTVLVILALLCYYGGFFFAQRFSDFDFKPACVKFSRSKYPALVCGAVVIGSALVAGVYLQQHGGVSSYMRTYFSSGRARTEFNASIFFVVGFGVTACLIWYALDEKATKNPLFWAAMAYAIPINFFLTGSRGSLFKAAALFLMVWMIRHRKPPPKGRVVAMGLTVVLLIGVLGDFRTSAYSGHMNWSLLTDIDVTEAAQRSNKRMEYREKVQGGVPIVARVPEEVGFLMGRSYLVPLFFFVPRFLWKDKPKMTGGALNGEIILKQDYNENITAVPPGGVSEAYWNFSIPGVIIMYFIWGMFHKWLARTLRRYPFPPVWVVYVVAVLSLRLTSDPMTTGMREVLAVVGMLFAVGALSLHWGK